MTKCLCCASPATAFWKEVKWIETAAGLEKLFFSLDAEKRYNPITSHFSSFFFDFFIYVYLASFSKVHDPFLFQQQSSNSFSFEITAERSMCYYNHKRTGENKEFPRTRNRVISFSTEFQERLERQGSRTASGLSLRRIIVEVNIVTDTIDELEWRWRGKMYTFYKKYHFMLN